MSDYVNATLRCIMAEEDLAKHAPASPLTVGIELSHQVRKYVEQQSLGYYPAIDFFRQEQLIEAVAIEPDLLEVYDSLQWLGEQLIQSEFRTRLRSVFVQHRILEIHHHASTLPKVKPGSVDAANLLAAHYAPTRFKIDFQGRPTPRVNEASIPGAALFALRDSFEQADFVYYEYCKS